MNFIIAVFKVRSQTMAFYDKLKRQGVMVNIINTPKQAKVSCGISVRFPSKALPLAYATLENRFDSFVGFFELKIINGHSEVLPLKK